MTPIAPPLQFGMFLMPVHAPNKPLAQCCDEDLELVIRCEETGFSDFWVGEHHSSTYENIVMPEIFLGKVLGLTKSIRIGAALSKTFSATFGAAEERASGMGKAMSLALAAAGADIVLADIDAEAAGETLSTAPGLRRRVEAACIACAPRSP